MLHHTARFPVTCPWMLMAAALTLVAAGAVRAAPPTVCVSASNDAAALLGKSGSSRSSLSADGRYVAFASASANFVPGGATTLTQVFVKDTVTGRTALASGDPSGAYGNGASVNPVLSGDGRYVAFSSSASNLIATDANGKSDIFVRDMTAGTTARVSTPPDGTDSNDNSFDATISADGRFVAYRSTATNLVPSDANGHDDIFSYDRQTGQTTIISIATDGTQTNDNSYLPSLSGDGRYVAYYSLATNLVAGDTNSAADIFLRDNQTGQTTRVSLATDGTQSNSSSIAPHVSGDGRYVVFESDATNLVPGDTNAQRDIFVRDVANGATQRASVASDGSQSSSSSSNTAISGDGRLIVFHSPAPNLVPGDTNIKADIFIHDMTDGSTARAGIAPGGEQGNNYSDEPAISVDGRFISFTSAASNLLPGESNNVTDIFVQDRQTGRLAFASTEDARFLHQSNGSSDLPWVSGDGRYAVFSSTASNLTLGDINGNEDTFVRDTLTNQTTIVSVSSNGAQGNRASTTPTISAISGDGRYAAYEAYATNLVTGDTNNNLDDFVHDLQTGLTTRISVSSAGMQGNGVSGAPSVSADGRYIAFDSTSTNLVASDTNGAYDVFVHDRQTGQTTRASVASDGTQANGDCYGPSISGDGRYVVFFSNAANIGAGAVLRDTLTGVTTRMGSDGYSPVISRDGRFAAFNSLAALVPGDTNGKYDVFVYELATGLVTRVSVASDGTQGNGNSSNYYLFNSAGVRSLPRPAISADGRYVAFFSRATNLVPGDTNAFSDIFVHDRATHRTTRISVAADGTQGNGDSYSPSISDDGRYIAYQSYATNLAPGASVRYSNIYMAGPLFDPFTETDVLSALRIAAGLSGSSPAQAARLNVEAAAGAQVDIADAVRIARKAAGLEPNP